MAFPYIATYIAFIFVIAVYAVKVLKVARMPMHLRWELYPVPHEKGAKYGGSYLEEPEWWTKPQERNTLRSTIYMLKQYFLFNGYFFRNRRYWVSLYPWHIGFYLIVLFHALAFIGALFIIATGNVGTGLYYATLVVAVGSFITGCFGSIGLFIERLVNKGLRDYASPVNYFNYIFFLIVFLSGLVAWVFFDPTMHAYREFWRGLITLNYTSVEAATYAHVILFALFLIYLPFTRSTHYITNLLAYVGVFWGDKPNLRGSKIERQIGEQLEKPVHWSAPHIQSGKKWSDIATEGVEAK